MKNRREFFKSVAAAGVAGAVAGSVTTASAQPSPVHGRRAEDRRYWVSVIEKLCQPVLGNLAKRELKKNMPVEAANPADRRRYTHLEAFGRLLAGIAPWLALTGLEGDETKTQSRF